MTRSFLGRDSGFIFIHLIVAVFILGMFLIFLGRAVHQYQDKVRDEKEHLQETVLLRSLIYEKMNDLDGNVLHFVNESEKNRVEIKLVRGYGMLTWEDECGKLNVNRLKDDDREIRETYQKFFSRLFQELGISSYKLDQLQQEMKDKKTIASLDDLDAIKNVRDEDGKDLREYLTVFGSGQININSASEFVLKVVFGDMDGWWLRQIVSDRQKKPFEKLEEMSNLSEKIKKFFTVRSTYYRIGIYEDESRNHLKMDVIVEQTSGSMKVRQWVEK